MSLSCRRFSISFMVSALSFGVASVALAQADRKWSAVERQASGQLLTVTASGVTSSVYLVKGRSADLVALDLASPALTESAREAAITWASTSVPQLLALADGERVEISEGEVHLGPDGLSVGQRRFADLRQIVRRIPSDSITEVRLSKSAGKRKAGAALIGLGVAGILAGAAAKNPESGPSPAFYAGATVALVGALFRTGKGELIYRR